MNAIFRGKILTIPNLLSLCRLCMVPWLVRTCAAEDGVGTVLLLLLSGLTDLLDGFIARRFDMVSNLGAALDPLADKLTQLAVMACLVSRFPLLWTVLGALCVKELFVASTSLLAIHRTGRVEPSAWHGKLAAAALYALLSTHLLLPEPPASGVMIALCTGLALLSGVLYGIRNLRCILSAGAEEEKMKNPLVKEGENML